MATNKPQIEDAIETGRAAEGTGTATGQEAARRDGKEKVPKGKARGSTVKSVAPVQKAGDYVGKPHKPIGAQKEPAVFVGNGAVDPNMVASPSGPVPISAVVTTPEEGEKRRKAQLETIETGLARSRAKRLDEKLINSMSAAELRAVANDRGYEISSTAGRRGTRAAFIQLQKDDKTLEK